MCVVVLVEGNIFWVAVVVGVEDIWAAFLGLGWGYVVILTEREDMQVVVLVGVEDMLVAVIVWVKDI